jgi:hypothetical protein
LQIDSVDQKLFKIQYTVCGNFSQGAGTSGTGSDITFSQLAVKGLRRTEEQGIPARLLTDTHQHHYANSTQIYFLKISQKDAQVQNTHQQTHTTKRKQLSNVNFQHLHKTLIKKITTQFHQIHTNNLL